MVPGRGTATLGSGHWKHDAGLSVQEPRGSSSVSWGGCSCAAVVMYGGQCWSHSPRSPGEGEPREREYKIPRADVPANRGMFVSVPAGLLGVLGQTRRKTRAKQRQATRDKVWQPWRAGF